jgi:hypothetical protein
VSAVATALSAFALVLLSIAAGLWLRCRLPESHLVGDSKDVIKLATALVATMSALVIALLFASTRASFETTSSNVGKLAANVIELDRLLKDYGEEGVALRRALRQDVQAMANSIWRDEAPGDQPSVGVAAEEAKVVSQLRELTPGTPLQSSLQTRAVAMGHAVAQIQLALNAQPSDSMARPFVIVLVLWLCFIFGTFAMSSEANTTLLGVLFFCALSAASAIYLILELGQPFDGLMQIPSAPLRQALAPI